MAQKPWLIMTLRRTGGTSLTSFLSRVSSFPTIEHEPFNIDRKLGHITREFKDGGDVSVMQAAVSDALAPSPNIKHCVEIIPLDITRALIDEAMKRDYHFMVLTRRDEARRLASLFLAMATGAWGTEQAVQIYPRILSGEIKPHPIDLQNVKARARADFFSIGWMLSMLRNRRIAFDWLLFEELYFGEVPIEEQARDIAAKLGIEIAQDDPKLAEFSTRDGQKSERIAPYVENYDAAVAQLKALCPQ